MTTIARTVHINAPTERVWSALADFPGIATWNPGVTASYAVGDVTTGIGAERVCEFPGALKPSVEEVIADWDEGRSLTVHITKGRRLPPFHPPMVAHFELAPAGESTRVDVELTYTLRGGPLGRAIDAAAARRQLGAGFTGLLAGLKHHIETGEAVSDTSGLELTAVSER